jgi:hypothetical protein
MQRTDRTSRCYSGSSGRVTSTKSMPQLAMSWPGRSRPGGRLKAFKYDYVVWDKAGCDRDPDRAD